MKTRPVRRSPDVFLLLLSPLLFLLITNVTFSFAQEFTATTIGNFGHVTVMEVTGNYDTKNPDGSVNSIARQVIAKEFFRIHKDVYDFIVIFSNFDFQMPEPEAKALYHPVKNDIQGIGIPQFDHSSLFGSNGKLQGIIDMGNISSLVVDPLDPRFDETLSILNHELMHRWGAYVRFKDADGSVSTSLLGRDGKHWSFLLDSSASVLYGNKWQSNGNGTFTSIDARKYYSPLDLYLMGFNDPSQVPPMLLIENPDIDPAALPQIGVTIHGTARYVDIEEIIAVEGPRIPGFRESQKSFRTAFLLITLPNTFRGDELYGIENIRNGWTSLFSILTDSQGLVHVASVPKEDIPTNPGIARPPVIPRTTLPDVEDGVRWLVKQQRSDGSWMELPETAERDTAEVLLALKNFPFAQESYSIGLQWLNVIPSGNMDYLSRKIEVWSYSGQDGTGLLTELLSRQNPDGGWGSNKHYLSNATDTSFALKALANAGYGDQKVVSKAIEYLKSKQNADGGWGNEDEESSIEATINVLRAFNQYKANYPLDDFIARGVAWLIRRQNPDGGFGNSPSTIYDTALAVLAFNELNLSREAVILALNYILSLQSGDGSWNGSPYQTAMAVGAIWRATIDPDLSIKSEDITFNPSVVTTLPADVSINAVIRNLGKTDVPQAKVVLYDGAIAEANKVGERILSFPGQTSVVATFSVTITDGNEHKFYLSIDPQNHVRESNESNNTAVKILYPGSTYDFGVSHISAFPNPADIFEDVRITSTLTNRGTLNAYNVQVRYYIDSPGGPFDIATTTVDIPANSTITHSLTWRANQSGENLPITVNIDPFNLFEEISEANNKGLTYLTVKSSTEPNLKVAYQDIAITPTPARERGDANISIPVKNDGFSSAFNVEVRFYKGVPGVDGILLGSQVISSLNAGEEKRVSIEWRDIRDSGERIIYIQVDPGDLIREVREDDNTAFTTLKILSLPDFMVSSNSITFTPPAPKEGDIVSIRVSVQNRGEQEGSNVVVRAYEKGAVIGSQTIPSIGGLSQTTASFIYDTTGKSGSHQIDVIVDPDHTILEQSKDNNRASRTFGVQNANLWLTEPYISPNGDGVKDSTQFFFRFEKAQTVKVVVVNRDGVALREFTGNEFENTTSGNIIWDGLDDDGRVVGDGQYQIAVRDQKDQTLGSLLVVVDNNRSPLTDAIGTKYLLHKNLTCNLPEVYMDWLPDESGFLLDIYSWRAPPSPEYPTGIYTMDVDGDDIFRLVPPEWTKGRNPEFDYFIQYTGISPSGEKVAFVLSKFNRELGYKKEFSELWVVDRDGKNLKMLFTYSPEHYESIEVVQWSPDSEHLSFIIPYRKELWIVSVSDGSKSKIDSGFEKSPYATFFSGWSPDSRKLAYFVRNSNNCDSSCTIYLRVADLSGNKLDVFETHEVNYPFLDWLNNNKIILSHYFGHFVWLVDASRKTDPVIIGDYFYQDYPQQNIFPSYSPNKNNFTFVQHEYEDTGYSVGVKILDGNEDISVLYKVPDELIELQVLEYSYIWMWRHNINNLIWSFDGRKIAFVDLIISDVQRIGEFIFTLYQPTVIIINTSTMDQKVFPYGEPVGKTCYAYDFHCTPPFDSLQIESFLQDNSFILANDGQNNFLIHSETGEKIKLPFWGWTKLSPHGRYIAYIPRYADRLNECYVTGRNYDYWIMLSLLNLTANLKVEKEKWAIVLKGIAADLNFEGYTLEYADVRTPNLWTQIAPPSATPVINDVFTTWVPPYEGTFYIRLTVRDKAGNVAWDRKRVSWGISSSITNLYKSLDIFSPNGDGVKDEVKLHYTVLEPVHLEFHVYDESNNLNRTFLKDHPLPTSDFILWDGRDEAGRVVADGKYKIKIFHYEFFVDVDKTPPNVDMALSSIRLGSEAEVDLIGHVFDERLKYWIIEYGEGENPQQWFEYEKGEDLLLKRDSNGNPILPIQDIIIETFGERHLEWLVGKKLRITAEDSAGNRRTVVSDFLEEVFVLNRWDGRYVSETIPADLARSGNHLIGGLETIRLPLLELRLQYWNGGRWRDGPLLAEPLSGSFHMEWDNSALSPMEGFAVRMKAIDLLGKEHYSNVLSTQLLFGMRVSCDPIVPVKAVNSLLEDLTFIRFQVRSDQDSRYYNWTEYQIWDQSRGDIIPVGEFIPPLPPIQSGMKYLLRMIGIGLSGKSYESGIAQYPPYCPVKITLKVDYPQAECGATSNRALLSSVAEGLSHQRVPQSLSYFIEKSGEQVLLTQSDLTKEKWSGVIVDTSQMSEGSYPVQVVLSYLDLNENTIKETSASENLLVDRVLPSGQITYPVKSLMTCPVTIADPKGNWYGIAVEGLAADNKEVKRYELFYGFGENPLQWLPASSQRGGKSFPIAGAGGIKGRIGIWDIAHLTGTSYSLMLKVTDIVGNTGCFTTTFSIDQVVEIPVLATDKSLFSPNGDEIFDRVQIHYEVNESAKVDVKAFRLLKREDGFYFLDSAPVRMITSGLKHLGGIEQTEWDGQDDSKTTVPDGLYAIAVYATDSCNNTNMKWISVEVDNTPPTTMVAYPKPGDPVGNIVEVKGTADDLNFFSFNLEVGQGESPETWASVSSGTNPVMEGVLGRWNTFGLQGKWTLRLTAIDMAGNRSIATAGIALGIRKELIKSFIAVPHLFSPNQDGKLDTVRINYELTDPCDVKIEIFDRDDVLKRTHSAIHSGNHDYIWDGKDLSGATVPDGVYSIKLTAALLSNPSLTQEEIITVIVDSTPPLININQPLNNSFHRDVVLVNGTVKDENLLEYSITYTGDSSTVLQSQGNLNRENYSFGILRNLGEGDYTLMIKAKDLAENITEKRVIFTVDQTPPKVNLDHPKDGEYYGSGKSVIGILGTVNEKNLDVYHLRYGSGDNPTQWSDLTTGNAIPVVPQLFFWKVGKDDGIVDGLYTLSLLAKDKAGQSGEVKVRLIVDNTPPETAFAFPKEGDYLKTPIEIRGTAFDQNLEKYILELSNGQCGSAQNWTVIKTATTSVKDGLIALWNTFRPDGDYCLRLTAGDRVGNRSEVTVNVKIDTHPPSAPKLSGAVEDRSNAKLTWTKNLEPDLSGYNLYRDGQKINSTPIKDIIYLDRDLKDGIYAYKVKAIDLAGNESDGSNQVKVTIDLKGPDARISSPRDGSMVSGLVNIKGTAYSYDDFKQYRAFYGQGSNPANWTLLRTSPLGISSGLLAQWDTVGLSDGLYSIKLEAEDLSGNITTHPIAVTLDNTPPSTPVLISAIASGSDVILTWRANTETDLTGYLLFRNHQIVNASGMVLGDLQPYLITGTTYLDKGVPDGHSRYYLIAMDQAGNMSDPSNAIEIEIDNSSPRARIVEPLDKSKFQDRITILAECPDTDLASIQFQYKRALDITWINLGSPVTYAPYVRLLDPIGLGLTHGEYHLRAVALDRGGRTDPSPSYITVTYTDLTPPAAPKDLKALTNGKDVTLTWTANEETDLNGYHVYRKVGSSRVKLNASPLKEAIYQDKNLPNGSYTYEVTAVDAYGNESLPSNSVSSRIYAPSLLQPYTPTGQKEIHISGYNASPSSSVEILNQTTSGISSAGKVIANNNGSFSLAKLDLQLGENKITAKATDNAGNISRASEMVVIVFNEPPSAPTGLVGSLNGFDVSLTWDPNDESDLSGYNIYRDGKKLNASTWLTSGDTAASSFDDSNLPSMAFDSNPWTYWMAFLGDGYGGLNPAWWEIDLSSPELINRVEIEWGYGYDEQGNWNLYAGSDFEIQVWSGYAWITQATVTWNYLSSSIFEFKPSYRTDKIRIFITDSTDPNYQTKELRISEVRILKDTLITETSYIDTNLQNGFYNYRVTAVDYYGFESLPSEKVRIGVGDVTPPSPPQNLRATVSGSEILLQWDANSEPDLAGYNLYRMSPQGWGKINISLNAGTHYTDRNLPNGVHLYRVTAVDTTGNESLPSNEAEATVYEEPPPPPTNLRVVSLPEGRMLRASWDIVGTPAGYNLYRAETSGGPYQKVNLSPILYPSYLDGGLINGKAYYYVVTAIDFRGNESLSSNEAVGVPQDRLPPLKPDIYFPTRPGTEVILTKDHTDISGTAEPGVTIELFKNGISVGKTITLERDVFQRFSLYCSEGEISISPDGKNLACFSYGYLMLIPIPTGALRVIGRGDSPLWSPDGTRMAYLFEDDLSNQRIALYDIENSKSQPLTNDIAVTENAPSWTHDGDKIAFISNRSGSRDVWIKDLRSDSLTQITMGKNPFSSQISPDGKSMVYFEGDHLYLMDLIDQVIFLVDNQTDGASVDWSPDSKRIAFVSRRNGHADIYILDLSNRNQMVIAGSPYEELNPVWSPDGKNVLFVRKEMSGTSSLWITPIGTLTQERLLKQGLYDLGHPIWSKSGGIFFKDLYGLNRLDLEGSFKFSDILLDPGENVFDVTAIDGSGNVSPFSDAITLLFDAGSLPDLTVTANDIFVFPPSPVTGEEVTIAVAIKNSGGSDVRKLDVAIYLYDPEGTLELIKSETIPSLPSQYQEWIVTSLDTRSRKGVYEIIAFLDPQDRIEELSEANNFASKEFFVSENEGIFMSTFLDSSQYRSDQDLNVHITIRNSGFGREVVLDVAIEDETGATVTMWEPIYTNLPYGSQRDYRLTWNTGSTYAGSYRVRTILRASSEVIAENISPFTILADVNIESTFITEKTCYRPYENVAVNFILKNLGRNYIIPEMKVKMRIVNSLDQEVFKEEKVVRNLYPDTSITLSSTWNTGLHQPGDYRVIAETFLEGQVISEKFALFKIEALPILTGDIVVTPPVIFLGNSGRSEYTIRNDGNTDITNLVVRVFVMDPETQTILSSREDTIPLNRNSSWKGEFTFSTSGYDLKTYSVCLQYTEQGTQEILAKASFFVKDGKPPLVFILSPLPNHSYLNPSTLPITALATDDGSGVDKVEYQIDGGVWRLLPISDPSQGHFSTAWIPEASDEGMHSLSIRAYDRSGNVSAAVSVTFSIDLNLPPVANAGPDQNVMTAQVVTLNGSESYDPEGAMITFLWTFVEVPSGSSMTDASLSDVNSAKPQFRPDVNGNYRLQLIVNDGVWESIPDEVIIYAALPNVAPNADAGPDQNVLKGDTVYLDGSQSNDPDNGPKPLSYLWSFSIKPTGSSLTDHSIVNRYLPNASFMPDAGGLYELKLAVSDGEFSSEDTVQIIAATPNVPPNANAGEDITITLGEKAMLNGSKSTDPDHGPQPLAYLWTFVAKASGSKLNNEAILDANSEFPTFIPDVAGTYVLQLMVFDGIDAGYDNVAVTVIDNVPPTLSPMANLTTLWPPDHRMVDIMIWANASDNKGSQVMLDAVVKSNEPQDGLGDGDTSPDWTEPVIDQNQGIITLKIRAERSGKGNGRIYTIIITATDISGNSSQGKVEIRVPRDKGKN